MTPAPAGGGASGVMAAPLTYSEQEIALARAKSYSGHAVVALVLGIFMWLPGLIATILFRNDAKRSERIAGQSLPGVGCLTTMLWLYIISAVLGVIIFVAIVGSL